MLTYKLFIGSQKMLSDGTLYGEIINMAKPVSFQGKTLNELINAFHAEVDKRILGHSHA